MKKWFLLLLGLLIFTISNSCNLKASSDYKTFESIEIKNGKFLSDFTTNDYKTYYKKVTKRRFIGWRTHVVNKDSKVTYKTETLFSYYNDGLTPIDYNYEVKRNEVNNISVSSTGNIGLKLSGDKNKFKGGLDSALKINVSSDNKTQVEEKFKMTLKVDPGTMLNLFILGEGQITNGVAASYIFWIRNYKGGFEVFTVTTQYYRLEKVKI